ncbi:hypothetical protein [Burkholderia ubonensis]|uniref:hypothetical protein n=1 Tax=Burkholderia ubonensis TaxID=101571 RepID=UPI000ADC0100|nr:hypothetical protein [Burkholderia ubonensis]
MHDTFRISYGNQPSTTYRRRSDGSEPAKQSNFPSDSNGAPDNAPVNIKKNRIEIKGTNSLYDQTRSIIRDRIDKLAEDLSFGLYADAHNLDPRTLCLNADGSLTAEKRSVVPGQDDTRERVIVEPGREPWAWKAHNITAAADNFNVEVLPGKDDVPLVQMLSYYGIQPSSPNTIAETKTALKSVNSIISDYEGRIEDDQYWNDASRTTIQRSQTPISVDRDMISAINEDLKKIKKALEAIVTYASAENPAGSSTASSTQEILSSRIAGSIDKSTATPRVAAGADSSSIEERQNIPFERANKAAQRRDLEGLEHALSSISSENGATPGVTTDISFQKESPFGKAHAEASEKLRQVTVDIPDPEKHGSGWTQDRVIASVDSDNRVKLDIVWTKDEPSTKNRLSMVTNQYEGSIGESSVDPIQIALRAVRQTGGRVTYTWRDGTERASLQSMLLFYGVEPADPKTSTERQLALDAVRALSTALYIANSPDQLDQLADLLNLEAQIKNIKNDPAVSRFISPSKGSPLGLDPNFRDARKSLKQFIHSAEFRKTFPMFSTVTPTAASVTVDEDGVLKAAFEYSDNKGGLSADYLYRKPNLGASENEAITSLRDSVLKVGGTLQLNGAVSIEQALAYYGIPGDDLTTTVGRQTVLKALSEVAATVLMGETPESIDINALIDDSDEAIIVGATARYLGDEKFSLLDKLGSDVIEQENNVDFRDMPKTVLQKVLSSEAATEFTRILIKELGWDDAANGADSFGIQAKLLKKAITLHLEAAAKATGNDVGILGYQFDRPENWGRSYKDISTDFENHLIDKKLMSYSKAAALARYALQDIVPVEFSISGVPESTPYVSSPTWVAFAQGINIAEAIQPGSARTKTFGQLLDLPGQMVSGVQDSKLQQFTTAMRLKPVVDWAVANGVLTLSPNQCEFSDADVVMADSKYNEYLKDLLFAWRALTEQPPSLNTMAKAELKKIGIPADRLQVEIVNRIGAGAGTAYVKRKYPIHEIYLNGELSSKSSIVGASSDIDKFNQAKGKLIDLPGAENLKAKFEVDYESFVKRSKLAYGVVIKSLLEKLPSGDRGAIENGEVALYSVRKATEFSVEQEASRPKAVERKIGRYGFILGTKFNGENKYFEIFPHANEIRPLTDPIIIGADLVKHSGKIGRYQEAHTTGEERDLPLDWNAYLSGAAPRSNVRSKAIIERRGAVLPTPDEKLPDSTRSLGFFSERSNEIASLVGNDIFFADLDELRTAAYGQNMRESDAKKISFAEHLKELVPFWSSIEQMQSDDYSAMHWGAFSFGIDALSFVSPFKAGIAGIEKSIGVGSKQGLRAASGILLKASGKVVKSTLNEIVPYGGDFVASAGRGGIAFTENGLRVISNRRGDMLKSLQRGRYAFENGFPVAKNPAGWRPSRPTDQLRTVDGVANVPMRNVGTANTPEFAIINPKTDRVFGSRFIEVGGKLERKPNLKGYEVNSNVAKTIDGMPYPDDGIYKIGAGIDRKEYIKINGKPYESFMRGEQRYVKHQKYIGATYQVVNDGQWRVVANGGLGGGKRPGPPIGRYDGAPVAKQSPRDWNKAQQSEYEKTLQNLGQNDGAIRKIKAAAEAGTLTPAQKQYHDAGVAAVESMPASTAKSPSSGESSIHNPPSSEKPGPSSSITNARRPEPGLPAALARMRLVPPEQWPKTLYHYTKESNFSQMLGDNALHYSTLDWRTRINPIGVFMTQVAPEGKTLNEISRSIFPTNFKFEEFRPNTVEKFFEFDTTKMPAGYKIYKSNTPGSQEYFVTGTAQEKMGLVYRGSILGKQQDYLVRQGDTVGVGRALP